MSGPGKIRRYSHYFGRFVVDMVAGIGGRGRPSDTVLIVRPDGIGDFVVWLDAARQLRQHFTGRRMLLVANTVFADLARRMGCFDDVIACDWKAFEWDLAYRFRLLRQLRRLGASIAIHPVYARRFWHGDAMVRASGAAERIGFAGDANYLLPWQRRLANHWYTQLVPSGSQNMTEHLRNAEFLRDIGIDAKESSIGRIGPIGRLHSELESAGSYFVLFPGAGSSKRLWPAASYAQVARAIARRTDWRLVVCGSGADADMASAIVETAGLDGSISLAGETTLPELVEVIRAANLVIGNETSAVHIAAAVDTPSVCLLGGGHYGRFVPYADAVEGCAPVPVFHKMECFGCNWHCTQPHVPGEPTPCITAITADAVIAAVEPLLPEKNTNVIEAH